MALGDSQIPENPGSIQFTDGAALQAAMAGNKMSTEAGLLPAALTVPSVPSDLPPVGIVSPAATASAEVAPLDTTKTVNQLMSEGAMQPIEGAAAPAVTDAPAQSLKPGESPQVTVTYSDAAGTQKPDFIVKTDGTIQAAGDPSAVNKQNVVIQVERPDGSVANPNPTEQKSIDGLVNYLYGRYSAEDPSVAQNGLKLNDQYGLISSNVADQVASKPDAPDAAATTAAARHNFAPQTQQAMSQGSRFTPGSSGSMSRGDIDNSVPERSEPLAKDETQSVADMKNAIAAEYRPDAATSANPDAPYQTSRMDRIGGTEMPSIGRYGMTYPIIRSWFGANFGAGANFDFDDETDDSIAEKMDNLAKHGKVSKTFAAKFHNKAFAHKFLHAMHEMKEGHMISSADLKDLMPNKLQEQIAADTVGNFAKQTNGDTGKAALAFHLGKSPDQLSAAELNDPGNKEYERTAATFGQLSHARNSMGSNDHFNYTVGQDGTLIDQKLKQAAISTAESMGGRNSEGLCATGAQVALQKAGMGEFMGSGNGYAMHHAFDRDPNWVAVDRQTMFDALQKGHVGYVCRQWASNPGGAGHVELLSMNNSGTVMGASDFYGAHRQQNNYYNWRNDKFYLPKADVENA